MIVLSMVGKTYRLTQDMKDAAAAPRTAAGENAALTLKQIYADAPGQGAVVWQLGARGRRRPDEVQSLFREVLPKWRRGAPSSTATERRPCQDEETGEQGVLVERRSLVEE